MRRSTGTFSSDGDSVFSGSSHSLRASRRQVSATRFRWSSNTDYILFTTVCTLCTTNYQHMTQHYSNPYDPNILQFMIVYAFIGLPLVYIQVVIGQYTQMSIIFIKHMCPIAHGVAYTALLNILAHTIDRAIFLAMFMVYLLTSLRSELQWIVCPDTHANICWNGLRETNCTTNCLVNHTLSAKLYHVYHHIEQDLISSNFPLEVKKVLPLAAAWVFLTSCLVFTHSNYKMVLVTLLVSSICCLVVFFCGCLITEGGLIFFSWLPKLNTDRFYNLPTWTDAVGHTYLLLALGRPFHVMAGSFLNTSANSGILAVAAVCINFVIAYFMSWIALSCYGIIQKFSNSDDAYMDTLSYQGVEIIFCVIPQALGFMGMPQLWSTIYFTGCTLLQANNLIVAIMTLEKSFCDTNAKLLRYTIYITILISSLIFILCMFVYTGTNYYFYTYIKYAIGRASAFSTCVITAVICFMYGVQKLCDDIHFMTGHPPTIYWKICWYMAAPLIIAYLIASTGFGLTSDSNRMQQTIVVATVLISATPIVICAVIEIFVYMRKKNLIGLLRPTDTYGPPDPEDKYFRQVHNPRSEIKSTRRNDACGHRCLIGNRAFRKAVFESQEESSIQSTGSLQTHDAAGSFSNLDIASLHSKFSACEKSPGSRSIDSRL